MAEETIITVKLRKGLADRNRLPLAHVLSILEEFRQMLSEAGRKIQRERGVTISGDFGLEVLAGDNGFALRKGSVAIPMAITANVRTGVLAAQEVVRVLSTLEREEIVPDPDVQLDRGLLRRVTRVARIQKADKLELEISVERPEHPEPLMATFGEAGMASLKALQTPTFEVEGITIYGKLVELIDRDQSDEDGKWFWGELRRENGEPWRAQFRPADIDVVTRLFRKQVMVSGRAIYYRVVTPKIVVDSIAADTDRDYEAAFDELFGCYREDFKTDTASLIKKLREG